MCRSYVRITLSARICSALDERVTCASAMIQKDGPESQSPGLVRALDYIDTIILKNHHKDGGYGNGDLEDEEDDGQRTSRGKARFMSLNLCHYHKQHIGGNNRGGDTVLAYINGPTQNSSSGV